MNKTLLIALGVLLNAYGFAQTGCAPGTGQFNANMNNYQAHLLTDGDMFWNTATKKPATFIPKNSNISPIFTGSIWMGGFANNNLHVASMTYRQSGVDYWPGPIDTVTMITPPSLCGSYDTFFPIYKTQVDSQVNNLYTAATMPTNILNWPGNGVSASNTSHKLAPYVDVNLNGIYDPLNGDYPIMRGDYSVYQIFNDVANHHSESDGLPLGVEVHLSTYVLNCNNDSALWNTLFLHYDIIHRAPDTVSQFKVAMFSDFMLGNPFDDYIGCDTNLNMYYAYNANGYDKDTITTIPDGPGCPLLSSVKDTLRGYHQYLPAMAGLFLNQKMSGFIYANFGCNMMGNPAYYNPSIYYNFMNGLWLTGAPITYGGAGLTAANPPCSYVFPGDPVSNTGWTQPNGGNAPYNMRGVGSCGPYTFYPNDTLKLDFAYVFARDYANPGNNLAPITKLRQYVQNIQTYYNTNTSPCGSTFNSTLRPATGNISNRLLVYPNPAVNNITISSTQLIATSTIQLTDVLGSQVMQTNAQRGKATIDISNLQQGVYFIKTSQGTAKFIKQ